MVPFEDTVKQRVVRLYDAEGAWKGTGYIVTAEALITPSTNLKKYAGTMKFMLRTKSNREVREIGPNEPYNKFLSVALVSNSIPIHCYPRISNFYSDQNLQSTKH